MLISTTERESIKLMPTGDQNTTINTTTAITGLSFSADANAIYEIDGFIHCGCNNTGGVKFDVDIPAATTMFLHFNGFNNSATDGGISNAITVDATLSTNAFCLANNANGRLRVGGTITTGASSGTVQFGFASGTSTQTSTIYRSGTVITITRVG